VSPAHRRRLLEGLLAIGLGIGIATLTYGVLTWAGY
jgi:hypothetical protein